MVGQTMDGALAIFSGARVDFEIFAQLNISFFGRLLLPLLSDVNVGQGQGGNGLVTQPVKPRRRLLQLSTDGRRLAQGVKSGEALSRSPAQADAVGLTDESVGFAETSFPLRDRFFFAVPVPSEWPRT